MTTGLRLPKGPKPEKPCSRCKVGKRKPGLSWCQSCTTEAKKSRKQA